MELENLENLIDFTVPVEHGFLFNEFCENAAHSPNVNTQTVLLLSEKNLRSSVPKRLNLVGQRLDWNSESSG